MTIQAPERITRIRPRAPIQRAGTLAELAGALEAKARSLECAHDSRAAFCRAYAAQAALTVGLVASGELGPSAAWVERMEIEAGHSYLRALEAWTRGESWSVPAPWRAAFSKARHGSISDHEELRVSTIAHIGYDVPMAMGRAEMAHEAASMRGAFERVTTELASAMPRRGLFRAFSRRGVAQVARLRARAFDDGLLLLAASNDAELRDAFSRIESRVLLEVAAR